MAGTVSYSQVGEDLQLAYLLGRKDKVTYLDAGCLWPRQLSNTFFFYERGGHGLCVDPNPDVAPDWAKLRPRDTFLNVGLGSSPGRLPYFTFGNPVFNTFSASRAARVARRGQRRPGREQTGTVDVEIITLDDAIARTGFAARCDGGLDILSVDVEGLEVDVLRGLGFEGLRPRVIVCEWLRSDARGTRPEDSPIARHLGRRDYEVGAYTGHDLYLIDANRR